MNMWQSKFVFALLSLLLLGCAGMSGPIDGQHPGGPVSAAAPSYPTGVAAPVLDDSTKNGGIKKVNVNMDFEPGTTSDGSPAANYRVKGTVVCRLEKDLVPAPCPEGLTFRVVDGLQKKFVETHLKGDGAFEVAYNFDPALFPGGTDFKSGLLFLLNLDPQFHASQYDAEVSCGDLCQKIPENYLSAGLGAAVDLVQTPVSQ